MTGPCNGCAGACAGFPGCVANTGGAARRRQQPAIVRAFCATADLAASAPGAGAHRERDQEQPRGCAQPHREALFTETGRAQKMTGNGLRLQCFWRPCAQPNLFLGSSRESRRVPLRVRCPLQACWLQYLWRSSAAELRNVSVAGLAQRVADPTCKFVGRAVDLPLVKPRTSGWYARSQGIAPGTTTLAQSVETGIYLRSGSDSFERESPAGRCLCIQAVIEGVRT